MANQFNVELQEITDEACESQIPLLTLSLSKMPIKKENEKFMSRCSRGVIVRPYVHSTLPLSSQ